MGAGKADWNGESQFTHLPTPVTRFNSGCCVPLRAPKGKFPSTKRNFLPVILACDWRVLHVFRGCLAVFPQAKRATGRGSADGSDEPQGRKITEPEPLVKQQPWEPKPLDEEQTRNNPQVIPIQAGRHLALLRCQDPFARWLARQTLVDCRTCRGGECAPGPGKRAAVRQQARLPRRDRWNLRSGVQRPAQLSAPRARIRARGQTVTRQSGSAGSGDALPRQPNLGAESGTIERECGLGDER